MLSNITTTTNILLHLNENKLSFSLFVEIDHTRLPPLRRELCL